MPDPRPIDDFLGPEGDQDTPRPFPDPGFGLPRVIEHTPISLVPGTIDVEIIIGQYEWARTLRDEGLDRPRIERVAVAYLRALAGAGVTDPMRFETNLAVHQRLLEAILNALFREPHHGGH
ncbi:hypothetical protein [Singulisphaera sp. PoT]|uniref:hypothetical protein n=1 Tax=Singulisphaera sp. PoT TaxID=3411797 RepID=UPI003BF5AA7E